MDPLLLLLLLSALSLAVHGQGQSTSACVDSSVDEVVCVSVESSGRVTVATTSRGWLGLGFGASSMASQNATTVAIWRASNSSASASAVVSKRLLNGHRRPAFVEQLAVLSLSLSARSDNAWEVVFALDKNLFVGEKPLQCIWALSRTPPADVNDPASSFSYHSSRGSFVLPLFQNLPAISATYSYDTANTFGIIASRDVQASIVTITVFSAYSGWVGVGIGTSMSNTLAMFVGWSNNSTVVLSQRSSTGHSLPYPAPNQQFTLIPTPATVQVPSSALTIFSFTLPSSSNLISTLEPTSFIFAVSNKQPKTPSDPNSSFSYHALRSTFTLDLSTNTTTTPPNPSIPPPPPPHFSIDLIAIHAACMFTAWALITPSAIFIARYLKTRLASHWYTLHSSLFLYGVAGLTALGLLAVQLSKDADEPRFVASTHGVVGSVLAFVVVPGQVVLGYCIDKWFDAERSVVPWWDKVHWWVGRVGVLLAVVNMHLGVEMYSGVGSGWVVGYWVWILVVVVVLFGGVGERMLGGAVHHVAGDGPVGQVRLEGEEERDAFAVAGASMGRS